MDLGTLIGLTGASVCVLITMAMSGSLMMYWDFLSVMIVVGGAVFATMTRWPLGSYISGLIGLSETIFDKVQSPAEIVDNIVELADIARKQSILALEKVTIENPFLAKVIRHMVDGYESDVINEIMLVEISQTKKKNKQGKDILVGMGEAAPAFGMIGTVVGLVVIMANLSDPDKIGPGLAVALITTLYGALLSNMILMPLSAKMEYRGDQKVKNMAIIYTGVNSMLKGQSPRAIRDQLQSYVSDQPGAASEAA